jgi:Flp pilus assembly protein TadG
MMRRLIQRSIRSCRRFGAAERGLAAIEFAMIAPVLVVMFLATFDGGRAIAAYMKMRSATYVLASITNQYATIAAVDMSEITGATAVVMAPYTSAPTVTISQIQINASKVSKYEWSATLNGTAHSAGTTVSPAPPSNMVVASTYLILAEVSYTYTPLFGFFGPKTGITFSDSLYVTPRGVSCIVYQPQSSTC